MKKMRNIILVMIMATLVLYMSACSQTLQEEPENSKIKVYTSIYPVYDFAKKIGGDHIQVELLVPPGAEPHGWEPSAKMVAQVEKAHVFLYNGLEMDPWAERLADSLEGQGVKTLALGEVEGLNPISVQEEHGEEEHGEEEHGEEEHGEEEHGEEEHGEEEHEHGTYDPHIWLDPMAVEKMAETLKDCFIEIDGEHESYYENNFVAFQKELEKLDEEYKNTLSQVEKREFIVTHAAFGYLARRYDLTQISITGLSPQAEPSPSKLVEVTNLVKEHNIQTIFFENLANPKLAQVLAKETGTVTETLNPIGGLTQEEIEEGKEYLSIMRENLEKLKKALE